MRHYNPLAATAAWMHQQNTFTYPCKLSFTPNMTAIAQRIQWIGFDLAECARNGEPHRPFIHWDWHPYVEDDEPEDVYADLVFMRNRLGPVTPLLTPWLPWLLTYVSATRALHGKRWFFGGFTTVDTERAAELLGRWPQSVLGDAAAVQAVQDCIRVACEFMDRDRRRKKEPWHFAGWRREF